MELDNTINTILILDDETHLAEFIAEIVEESGMVAMVTSRAADFFDQYQSDLRAIILDLVLPEIDGIEIIRYLAQQQSQVPLILMSGYDLSVLHSASELAMEAGLSVCGTLTKPISIIQLESLLSRLPAIGSTSSNAIPQQSTLTVADLMLAIDKDQIHPWFQPQLDMNTAAILGVEALVRWEHPQLGLIMPDTILRLAEEGDLLQQITDIVLVKSLDWLANLDCEHKAFRLSVNFSAQCLNDLDLPEQIVAELDKRGIAHSQLVIELTENHLMVNVKQSIDILTRLRMRGMHISIDDFGTGYSSLVQLYRLPFGELKIDKSFVNAWSTDEAKAIIKMSVLLAHELKMSTVAEGIETRSDWKNIHHLGCDYAQGYYIARPMRGEDFLQWRANHNQQQFLATVS